MLVSTNKREIVAHGVCTCTLLSPLGNYISCIDFMVSKHAESKVGSRLCLYTTIILSYPMIALWIGQIRNWQGLMLDRASDQDNHGPLSISHNA